MVSLPIFIILLGILVSVSNLTASSWEYEPTGQTIETLSSDTAVTFDNPSGKTLAKRGDYEVTQRYVTIEAKQPSTGEIQQVKVLIREPKDAGNNRPGVVFMHGAGYGRSSPCCVISTTLTLRMSAFTRLPKAPGFPHICLIKTPTWHSRCC